MLQYETHVYSGSLLTAKVDVMFSNNLYDLLFKLPDNGDLDGILREQRESNAE